MDRHASALELRQDQKKMKAYLLTFLQDRTVIQVDDQTTKCTLLIKES